MKSRKILGSCFALIIGVFLIGSISGYSSQNIGQNQVGKFDHFITIVLENAGFEDAMEDPYLHNLATQGAVFINFRAATHPSYPNYLAMVGGETFGVWTDSQKTFDQPSIVDLLEAQGLRWKSYAEGYPGNCFLGSTQGKYARKHVPLLSFKSVQTNPSRCAQVVDASEFQKDWASGQLPQYSFYTPDLNNDGHNTHLSYASAWLKNFLTPLLNDPVGMKGTLIEITFDESGFFLDSNKIYTVLLGPSVKPGYVDSSRHSIYDILKMIEDNFGLGSLGKNDSRARSVVNIWAD